MQRGRRSRGGLGCLLSQGQSLSFAMDREKSCTTRDHEDFSFQELSFASLRALRGYDFSLLYGEIERLPAGNRARLQRLRSCIKL